MKQVSRGKRAEDRGVAALLAMTLGSWRCVVRHREKHGLCWGGHRTACGQKEREMRFAIRPYAIGDGYDSLASVGILCEHIPMNVGYVFARQAGVYGRDFIYCPQCPNCPTGVWEILGQAGRDAGYRP